MILLKRFSFWLALCGLGAAIVLLKGQNAKVPDPGPVSEPPRSPYTRTVASTGLIEASRENVKIASPREGLVTRVLVKVGDSVKAGAALFQLDDREVRARIRLLEAQAKSLWAQMQAKSPARAALLNRLARAGDLIDANVAATMNADLAFYRAMARAAHPDRSINDADLLAQIAAQEGDVRRTTAEWLFPFMALAYRDLPDADLAAYADFAESGSGRQLNRAMFAAFDAVYARISTELGRAVAQALVGQDI
ncbi:MAG: biotin/lipoyl-binding protein [Rhodobacteraceae bacterium]|nr:biotin/lipoyl-binding protein [Paracoccaceae bacterium]